VGILCSWLRFSFSFPQKLLSLLIIMMIVMTVLVVVVVVSAV
jgi:hypothetical protein